MLLIYWHPSFKDVNLFSTINSLYYSARDIGKWFYMKKENRTFVIKKSYFIRWVDDTASWGLHQRVALLHVLYWHEISAIMVIIVNKLTLKQTFFQIVRIFTQWIDYFSCLWQNALEPWILNALQLAFLNFVIIESDGFSVDETARLVQM